MPECLLTSLLACVLSFSSGKGRREERPHESTGRRWPSASQEEFSLESSLQHLGPGSAASRTVRKGTAAVQTTACGILLRQAD